MMSAGKDNLSFVDDEQQVAEPHARTNPPCFFFSRYIFGLKGLMGNVVGLLNEARPHSQRARLAFIKNQNTTVLNILHLLRSTLIYKNIFK